MSDLLTTRVFTDGEHGITAAKMNDIIGGASIQTAFYSAKSTASTADAADTLLLLKAAGSYAQVPVSTFVTSVAGQLPSADSEIWSVRLRSFNSVGNPNFEVDQRNCYAALTNPTGAILDRWFVSKTGTMGINSVVSVPGTAVVVPGTSFKITRRILTLTLATQQTTLGTSDNWQLYQSVEGSQFRELSGDVHSCSLLVRSSVANLKFSVYFQDGGGTKSLVKLCSLGAANTWTLISLANMPVFPAGSDAPGQVGYYLGIVLAAGTSSIAPAADTWQTGSLVGAPGMDNFASKPVNSTFDLAFVQHEPGPVCSTLMDKSFSQNLDEALKFYCKSYDFATKAGTVTTTGALPFFVQYTPNNNNTFRGIVLFPKPMAKYPPTVTLYNHATGAANSVVDFGAANLAVSAVGYSEKGVSSLTTTGATGNGGVHIHYAADTGW